MSSFFARLFQRILFKPRSARFSVITTQARAGRPWRTPYLAFFVGSFGLLWNNGLEEKKNEAERRKHKYEAVLKEIFAQKGFNKNVKALKKDVLVPGDGVTRPTESKYVQVNYTCWFLDGTEFDSSRPEGERLRTFEFKLGDDLVVEGLERGIKSMTVGERAWILVPPSLGFGDEELHAHGGVVPANSHLVFDIMLLSVSDRPKFDFGEDLEEKEKTEA